MLIPAVDVILNDRLHDVAFRKQELLGSVHLWHSLHVDLDAGRCLRGGLCRRTHRSLRLLASGGHGVGELAREAVQEPHDVCQVLTLHLRWGNTQRKDS